MFEKIFADMAEIGINLLVTALLISGIVVCITLSDQYHEKQLENQVIAEEIQEQRNNLFYNNTHVYQQDVVSMVLKYKGDREVQVRLKDGSYYEWSKDTQSSNYKVSEISALLPKDVLYDADIIWGPNMYDVVGYQFVEHQEGCGRN